MNKTIFAINKKNRFKEIVANMQKKECKNLLIHLHSSDGKKLQKRLKKLQKAFPNAKIFTTIETKEENDPLIAFICLDNLEIVKTIYPNDCSEDKCLELEVATTLFFMKEYFTNVRDSQLHILKQYRDAVNYATIVSKTNKRGVITYVNDNFCKMSGYDRDELIGKSHNIVRHPDTPKKTFKKMWETILDKKPWHGIIKNLRKDGSYYIVDVMIHPILDTSGEIIEFVALREDITKQIEDKKWLEAKEAELQAILDNQDSIVVLVSKEKGILSANRRFFDYFGFKDMDEFKKKHKCIQELFIKEEEEEDIYPKRYRDWLDFISSDSKNQHKAKMRNKDGDVHTFSLKIDQIKNENRFVINMSNISQSEEALIKAKLMEHSKSIFVANMSHEIRTPLNGILGFTELLLKQSMDNQAKKYLELIHKSGQTLLGIVNDILDLSKIESGKMKITPIPASLNDDLESVVTIFAMKAREKNISYTAFIDPNIPKIVICDIQRLKQVLSNLIGNAIKFTPENGKVEVLIKTIEKEDNRVKLHFEVKDSGIGIKEDQKSKIFDLFSQADDTISGEYGGTGLGLPISAKFIEMMGSRIEVDSKPQKGATFWFDVWFDINSDVSSIGSLLSDKKDINIVFCNLPNNHNIFETIKNYIEAWGLSWTAKPSCDDIPPDTTFLFIASDVYENEDIQRLLETHPNLRIVWVESSNLSKSPTDDRVYKLELPITASAFYNLFTNRLENDFEKDDTSKQKTKTAKYSGKILIAEDNLVNQLLITELIRKRGIEATVVENGIEVLEELDKNEYDLILMDINMPKMDGVEATKKLRENGFKIPVVALTANVMVEEKSAYLKAGMDDHIPKPIETQVLDRVLQKFLKVAQTQEVKQPIEPVKFDNIDYDYLGKAIGIKDINILKTLVKQFSKGIDPFLENLEAAMNSGNTQKLKDVVHSIKGATGNMRFNNSFTLCKEVEKELSEQKEINENIKAKVTSLMAQLQDLKSKS